MSIITPQTSSTANSGMVPNTAGTISGQAGTNTYWRQTLAEWMASMWAQGGQSRAEVLSIMSPIWYSAKFGEPDPSDQDGFWSPRTLLSFSRFASAYTPGSSAAIETIMPYVPPTGSEFIETPEQTALRVAQANFEKDLDARIAMNAQDIAARAAEGAATRAFQSGENAADRTLSASQTNAQIAAEMEGIKANMKQAAMSAFNNAFQNEISKFNVEAGMYNTQQGIQSANLQTAGSLSSVFQQLLDERTNKAIESQLNPGDWLQREAQVRAMTAPQGTETPAYSNYDKLQTIIDSLLNTSGGIKPITPDQNSFVIPPALQTLMNYTPTTPAPVVAPTVGSSGGGMSHAQAVASVLQRAGITPTTPAATTPKPTTTPTPTTPAQNTGTFSGIRNEDVAHLTPGQRALMTTGSLGPSYGRDYSSFKVYNPSTNTLYGPDDEIAASSPVWLERFAYGVRNSNSPQFISGDPQKSGKPNPEIVTINNPGPDTTIDVEPVKNKTQMRGKRKFAFGVDAFNPDDLKLKTYSDDAYQNYPSLRYFQRRLPKQQYDTLSTGYTTGYGGAQLPESGRINYGDYLNVAKDPVSLAMLASHYKSGSRDLFAEVARAKARAPFGQAVQTSLIRT